MYFILYTLYFIQVRGLRHGDPFTVRHYDLGATSHVHLSALHFDRKWFPLASAVRAQGGEGEWHVDVLEDEARLLFTPYLIHTMEDAGVGVWGVGARKAS